MSQDAMNKLVAALTTGAGRLRTGRGTRTLAFPVPRTSQKSTVALNRTNRGFRMSVGRSQVAPSAPNAWL